MDLRLRCNGWFAYRLKPVNYNCSLVFSISQTTDPLFLLFQHLGPSASARLHYLSQGRWDNLCQKLFMKASSEKEYQQQQQQHMVAQPSETQPVSHFYPLWAHFLLQYKVLSLCGNLKSLEWTCRISSKCLQLLQTLERKNGDSTTAHILLFSISVSSSNSMFFTHELVNLPTTSCFPFLSSAAFILLLKHALPS